LASGPSDIYRLVRRLPKVDLHRHLEGSLRLSTLAELSRTEHLDLPCVQVRPDTPRSPGGFLSHFELLRLFYRSPEIIRRLTQEAVEDAAQDGIRHLELHFTPAALSAARGFPMAEVFDWVIEAAREESVRRGVRVGLVSSVNRHEPAALAAQVAGLAADRLGQGIVGLNLAGDEAQFPAEPFVPIFVEAGRAGLGISVHAGEWAGAQSVRLAIEAMRTQRIGHGVRILEDASVVALARERGVYFEICLTSNVQSGVVERLADHPLPRMIEAGLHVTLNTDDPGVSDIRLSDEYAAAIEHLDLSMETLRGLILTAAQAAFLSGKEKAALEASLQEDLFRAN
jgi:adenosine deaminase